MHYINTFWYVKHNVLKYSKWSKLNTLPTWLNFWLSHVRRNYITLLFFHYLSFPIIVNICYLFLCLSCI